jgi:hypothetical protein
MKRTSNALAIACAIGLTSFSAVGQSPNDKPAEPTNYTQVVQREAKIDSAADYEKFKIEAEAKLKENRASISMLKAKKYKDAKAIQANYDTSVNKLEGKTQQIEKKFKESATTSTVQWTSYKREFNAEMDELNKAVKDMATKYPN